MRLVQLYSPQKKRRIALVKDDSLQFIHSFYSVYHLVLASLALKKPIFTFIQEHLSEESLSYTPVWEGKTEWEWLPCFDHPEDPLKCMVSGTGLTHRASAENRDKMNAAASQTDSMKMYLMGEEGGKPKQGEIGTQPEWFYKGNGSILKGHMNTLTIPNYALDGGEEPEIAGIYVVDSQGQPHRVGFATGNEFSDHVMEKTNYLYLAPSKIRECSIGPELVLDPNAFTALSGTVEIQRESQTLWQKEITSGENHMAHSLENLEYHHFKYQNHRVPGQVHIHFMGTGAFSFGEGIQLRQDDHMKVHWPSMGKALHNSIQVDPTPAKLQPIKPLAS